MPDKVHVFYEGHNKLQNLHCQFDTYSLIHSGRWTENDKKNLGEHKVITPKQQFLGIILCFFMHLKWLWLLPFIAKML
jgi:hypothetical protein